MNGQQVVHAVQQQVPATLGFLGLNEEEGMAHREFNPTPIGRPGIELNGVPELASGGEHLAPHCGPKITILEALRRGVPHG